MTEDKTEHVIDDEEHTDPDQEDIGELDLDGDGIPDELDVEDLDDLLAEVDPDAIEEPEDEEEEEV